MEVSLHGKQTQAFTSDATEILYGGAAGGGKSYLMRVVAVYYCLQVPKLQVYLFRRQSNDLIKNHLDGAGSFYDLLGEMLKTKDVKIVTSPNTEIVFKNGSKIHLCHCQHEGDVYKYQGSEIHILLIDELTHFSEKIYRYLRGRVRLGGLSVPKTLRPKLPFILCGSNPGNIGHSWVKRTFIDNAEPYKIIKQPPSEGGMLRQFIPALLEDNPTMTENDPNYELALEGLGNPALVNAMRYGDWNITAGAAFEKLRKNMHCLRPFAVPEHFTKFMVIDWGTAKPFAVGWFCVPDQDLIFKATERSPKKFVPKNSLILYREYYGWNGTPDVGCRMESFEVARQVLNMEHEVRERMDYRVGDSSMWSNVDGISVQERMYVDTDGEFNMIPSIKDRENNYQEMRARIAGEDGVPAFYATENCLHFWRTVPDLQLDVLRPEKGYDSTQEDHMADVLAYACASRPYSKTKRQRIAAEFGKARKKAFGENRGFYA